MINMIVTTRNFFKTAETHKFIEQKIKKFDDYFPGYKKAHIILKAEKYIKEVEIIFHCGNAVYKAMARAKYMYPTISQAVRKLEHELLRTKRKRRYKKGAE